MTTHERLRLARQSRGLTLADISDSTGIPEARLQSYEEGGDIDFNDIPALSRALNMAALFLQNPNPVVNVRPVSPRFDALHERQRTILIAQARLWLERYRQVEKLTQDSQGAEPVMWNTPQGFPRHCETGLDASHAAQDIRGHWNLGELPIRNVTYLLEDLGVKICIVTVPGAFDCCAFVSDDEQQTPLILIQGELEDGRHRYELSSQLAYFLLDRPTPQIAGHFAGGFLIPTNALTRDLGERRIGLDPLEVQMLTIKHGVSWRTLLARAVTLRIVPKEHFDEWVLVMEDDDAMGAEQADPSKIPTRLIELTVRLQIEDVIYESERAAYLQLPWTLLAE